jgi:hypothetical protein
MTTRSFSIGLVWGLASYAMVSYAIGSPIVDVGVHKLLPNTKDQEIAITVEGSDPVQGLNFRIQVEDGGPLPPAMGSPTGPVITAVDLITATVFAGNVSPQTDLLSLPQIWVQSVTTQSGSVVADGLLATVTFDTTGFSRGSFRLALDDTLDGATDFAGIPIDITDGILRVVPEPPGGMMGLLGFLVLVVASTYRSIA